LLIMAWMFAFAHNCLLYIYILYTPIGYIAINTYNPRLLMKSCLVILVGIGLGWTINAFFVQEWWGAYLRQIKYLSR